MTWNLADWDDLVVRRFHVTAAISWIGSSLYLLWFDRPEDFRKHAQRIQMRAVDSLSMPIGPQADMPRAICSAVG